MNTITETILKLDSSKETKKKISDIMYREECKLADIEMNDYIDTYFLNREHRRESRKLMEGFKKISERKKIYSLPKISIEYPEFLCFRLRIVRMNGKIVKTHTGEWFGIDSLFMKFWLKQAVKKIWQAIKWWGRGVCKTTIFLKNVLNDSIIPEDENFDDYDEDMDIEIIRI